METGCGIQKLRAYQLKLSDYCDLELLDEYLKKASPSTAAILKLMREEKVGSFPAIERLLAAAAK